VANEDQRQEVFRHNICKQWSHNRTSIPSIKYFLTQIFCKIQVKYLGMILDSELSASYRISKSLFQANHRLR